MADPTDQSSDSSSGRREGMFPRLTEAQIERVANLGTRRKVEAGEIVFEVGDRDTAFFVVLEGELEILRPLVSG
ncbi:MAG TPA: cyclic nucleotide-binding domain-containing protein, partial [Polyangia bacterium]|nr:cyclic nucleotide-binding domain-containing protein [Polyangia bacterium]